MTDSNDPLKRDRSLLIAADPDGRMYRRHGSPRRAELSVDRRRRKIVIRRPVRRGRGRKTDETNEAADGETQ